MVQKYWRDRLAVFYSSVLLKIVYKTEMDLWLAQVKISIIPFTYSPGQVKYTSLSFKCKTQTRTKITIILIYILAIVASPPSISKYIKKMNWPLPGTGIRVYPVKTATGTGSLHQTREGVCILRPGTIHFGIYSRFEKYHHAMLLSPFPVSRVGSI